MKTATRKTGRVKPAAKRGEKFTALEQKILQDGVSDHVSRAIAVNLLRQWEKNGWTPEEIAANFRIAAQAEGRKSVLGKPQPGDKGANLYSPKSAAHNDGGAMSDEDLQEHLSQVFGDEDDEDDDTGTL